MNDKKLIEQLTRVLQAASDHLDYCGYGDKWEREGCEGLRAQIEQALEEAKVWRELKETV